MDNNFQNPSIMGALNNHVTDEGTKEIVEKVNNNGLKLENLDKKLEEIKQMQNLILQEIQNISSVNINKEEKNTEVSNVSTPFDKKEEDLSQISMDLPLIGDITTEKIEKAPSEISSVNENLIANQNLSDNISVELPSIEDNNQSKGSLENQDNGILSIGDMLKNEEKEKNLLKETTPNPVTELESIPQIMPVEAPVSIVEPVKAVAPSVEASPSLVVEKETVSPVVPEVTQETKDETTDLSVKSVEPLNISFDTAIGEGKQRSLEVSEKNNTNLMNLQNAKSLTLNQSNPFSTGVA
jgi:hypothetical protein